jgi:hypothetical protein
MGTDDLFHKRKALEEKDLRRKRSWRKPYDRVLIVCEGEKTEIRYFELLRAKLRLSSANIGIPDGQRGTDPMSIVQFAIDEFKKDKEYDRVYCVFDRDKHTTFNTAVNKVMDTRRTGVPIHAITSVPCFEVWLLLHYEHRPPAFCTTGNDSNCDPVVSRLKKHIPNYEKGNIDAVFEGLYNSRNVALKNAKSLEIFHETSGADNPSTKVHELVEYLMDLKKDKP